MLVWVTRLKFVDVLEEVYHIFFFFLGHNIYATIWFGSTWLLFLSIGCRVFKWQYANTQFFFAFAGIFLAVCFFIWINIMFVPRIYGTFLMFLDRFSYFKQRRWLLPLHWIAIFRYREFLSLTFFDFCSSVILNFCYFISASLFRSFAGLLNHILLKNWLFYMCI